MTIDEAVVHAREVAENKYKEGMLCHANPDDGLLDGCIECAKEHEQLAEWLEELKRYRDMESAYEQGGKDAVKAFVEKLKREFEVFLTCNETNKQQDEFLLPDGIGNLIKQQKCTVDLLESPSIWYGVTYSQDKEHVVSSLKKLVDEGKYKKGLW